MSAPDSSRRQFLKIGAAVGGGLLIGFQVAGRRALAAAAAGDAEFVPNAFIRIGSDDSVTLFCNKSEMGQGVYTSLPMLVAEELEADWRRIRVEAAPVAPEYNHPEYGMQFTGGSMSIASEWERLRRAGAVGRELLIATAAARWGVDRNACRAENGRVFDRSGRSLSYGQLAAAAAQLPVPSDVPLKDPKQFKLLGKPTLRLDGPEKVNGTAVFGSDITVTGMLTAVIARPPVFGARLKRFDATKARAIPGVKDVVAIAAGVAVVATGFHSAKEGRDALELEWESNAPAAGLATAELLDRYRRLAETPGRVARATGDVAQALQGAAVKLEADYHVPYLAHAPMEPLNCVVDLKADRCEIWTGTQFQTVDRMAAARVAGLQPEQVTLHTTLLGGGFGRRANPASDFVIEAVQLAKAIKTPVKVLWTRDDDLRGGYYRPLWLSRCSAGLDGEGNPVAWSHRIVGQSIMKGTAFESMIKDGIDETSVEGAADLPYAIPNMQVELHSPEVPVPVLWWRSVGHSHTAFVVESFIDELAHAAGRDPVQFRRQLLQGHPRHLGVLDLAAQKSDWGRPLPAGRGRGIAVHHSFGSWVAEVAEVAVDGGQVRVERVVCAVDCGFAVNPKTIEAQLESAVAYGLSAALHGAITLRDGRVEQSHFGDYPILRIDEMPRVEVYLVPSAAAPSGIGEPGLPPIAPAVTNAIFAATGQRVRSLPISLGTALA
jgi:isoquinoline 1-oxidoreductase beta subunit